MHNALRNVFVAFVLRTLLIATLVAASFWNGLDTYAEEQVEAALQRALVAFAIARGLNGVISVAQGTEIAIQPAGVGVKLAPGELLDPVNDLVEQFSTVMLFASASLGLQRLTILMSAWPPLAFAIAALAILWLAATVHHDRGVARLPNPALAPRPRTMLAIQGALVVMLAMRFAVPLSALGSEAAYRLFLADEYEQSSAELELARKGIGEAAASVKPVQPAPDDLIDRAQRWIADAGETFDVEKRLQELQKLATAVTRNIVDLIAIFIVQTVTMPLLFMWLTWLAMTRGLPRLWASTRAA